MSTPRERIQELESIDRLNSMYFVRSIFGCLLMIISLVMIGLLYRTLSPVLAFLYATSLTIGFIVMLSAHKGLNKLMRQLERIRQETIADEEKLNA